MAKSKDEKEIKRLHKRVLEIEKLRMEDADFIAGLRLENHDLEVHLENEKLERAERIVSLIADYRDKVEAVYGERDRLVAALSKLFGAHLRRDPTEEEGFQTTVCVHLPKGQVTWHIADSELPYFDHLTDYDPDHQAKYDACEYDGHNTYIKYERLNALPDMDSKLNDPSPKTWAPHGHYFSKVTEVEAVPWTGRNVAAVKKFGGDKIKIEQGNGLMLLAGKDGAQDWVPVPSNHWIVCAVGDKSDLWPVHPEIFAAKYQP